MPDIERLQPGLRTKCEAAFEEDFSDISIDTGVTGQRLTSALCTISCTNGTTLFFAPGCYRPDLLAGEVVIAHELAHVAQRKRARRRARTAPFSDERFENEADEAAIAALGGRAYHDLSPDRSTRIRSWGPAGHYYTAYFALKAAGFADDLAARAAFFCQMPDQVVNLDAKSSGIAWSFKAALPILVGPAHARNYTSGMDKLLKVEEGLHCLTGRDSDLETTDRLNIIKSLVRGLQQSEIDCWAKFGLALHALGDSFAHRRSDLTLSTMYDAPYGHLIPGTDTDNINYHQLLYRLYGAALFAALLDVGKALSFKAVLNSDEFGAAISAFSSKPVESLQVDMIRGYSTASGLSDMRLLNPYAPETAEPAPISWREFFMKYHSQYKFDANLIERLQMLISVWAR